MRRLSVPIAFDLFVSFSVVISARAVPTETLTTAEAKNHIGETATVCGKVASSNFAFRSRGRPTFLNLDEPYPQQTFTVLIWGRNRASFGTPEKTYDGKSVCVTGTISEYRGVPEIIVSNPDQISVHTGFAMPVLAVLLLCGAGAFSFWYFRRRKRPIRFEEIKMFRKATLPKNRASRN